MVSGFGNTGTLVSGFNNHPIGGAFNGEMSGFFNTASGGSVTDSDTSGFFNTGITAPIPIMGFPTSGLASGFNSGLLNMGTGLAGLFNLIRL